MTRVIALGIAVVLALTGCAVNEAGSLDPSAPGLAGELAGVGSSAQDVAVQTWATGFQLANPRATVTYDAAGSGAGREAFLAGAVGFAGSDRAFTIEEIAEGDFDGCVADSDIIQLPAYVSPIAVVFNLEGIDSLNMDSATIARLFTGDINSWDDPAIEALNAGVDLPAEAVTPVHRADDSGTTANFTDYLFQAAPDEWEYEPSGVWPLSSGEAAQGNSGVIAAIAGGQGTIGYADASRAGGLGTVALQIGDESVPFSPEAAAAAVDASSREAGRTDGDLALVIDRTPDQPVYPIVLVTYSLACVEYVDGPTAPLVRGFLEYVISPDGQDAAAAAAGSAPISDEQRQMMQAAIDLIHVP